MKLSIVFLTNLQKTATRQVKISRRTAQTTTMIHLTPL
uniref:Uncharacterized protein n=1 Tax=Anguilla anguilla TaxID=7936 RepID=A0A0E9PXE4_ANGAN